MNSLKRFVTVLGLALGVVAASSIPASATFSDAAAEPTMTYATATVAAPGNVVGSLTCGSSTATLRVTWTASNAARISGYRVIVHWSDGATTVRTAAATATSWSDTTTTYNATLYAIQYSVTTLTDYGWSTQSGLTGSFRC